MLRYIKVKDIRQDISSLTLHGFSKPPRVPRDLCANQIWDDIAFFLKNGMRWIYSSRSFFFPCSAQSTYTVAKLSSPFFIPLICTTSLCHSVSSSLPMLSNDTSYERYLIIYNRVSVHVSAHVTQIPNTG